MVDGRPDPAPWRRPAFFYNPQGQLRAGWRLLIFVALTVVFSMTAAIAVSVLFGHPPPRQEVTPPSKLLFSHLPLLVGVGIATATMAVIERHSFGDYGVPPRQAFRAPFWQGAVWGFLALSALVIALRLGGWYHFGGLALSGPAMVKYGVIWALGFLLVGLTEELVSRGYALITLAEGIGFWPAAFFLALLFGASHLGNPGETWIGICNVVAIALFFSLTLRCTGSLWFAIGAHAAWDYGESFIYSTPDSGILVQGHLLNASYSGPAWLSGGSAGPEGSVLGLAVIAGLFVAFRRFHCSVPPKTSGTENTFTN